MHFKNIYVVIKKFLFGVHFEAAIKANVLNVSNLAANHHNRNLINGVLSKIWACFSRALQGLKLTLAKHQLQVKIGIGEYMKRAVLHHHESLSLDNLISIFNLSLISLLTKLKNT